MRSPRPGKNAFDAEGVLHGQRVMIVSGWHPIEASVSTSACMPLPPDGSDAAEVITSGGKSGRSLLDGHRDRGRERPVRTAKIVVYSNTYPRPDDEKWMCLICGWDYDEAEGAAGRRDSSRNKWENCRRLDLPDGGARKEDFEMIESDDAERRFRHQRLTTFEGQEAPDEDSSYDAGGWANSALDRFYTGVLAMK